MTVPFPSTSPSRRCSGTAVEVAVALAEVTAVDVTEELTVAIGVDREVTAESDEVAVSYEVAESDEVVPVSDVAEEVVVVLEEVAEEVVLAELVLVLVLVETVAEVVVTEESEAVEVLVLVESVGEVSVIGGVAVEVAEVVVVVVALESAFTKTGYISVL